MTVVLSLIVGKTSDMFGERRVGERDEGERGALSSTSIVPTICEKNIFRKQKEDKQKEQIKSNVPCQGRLTSAQNIR